MLETDGTSGNPQASYVLGGGELVSQDKGGVTSYYLKDGHGSVRSLADGTGNLVSGEQYNYDAFGSLVNGPTNPATKYLYTGQQFDRQTGLYDLRARYYNSAEGRFLSQDINPLSPEEPDEIDRYTYGANNAVNDIDPSGLAAVVKPLKPLTISQNSGRIIEYILATALAFTIATTLYQVGPKVLEYIAIITAQTLIAGAQMLHSTLAKFSKTVRKIQGHFVIALAVALKDGKPTLYGASSDLNYSSQVGWFVAGLKLFAKSITADFEGGKTWHCPCRNKFSCCIT